MGMVTEITLDDEGMLSIEGSDELLHRPTLKNFINTFIILDKIPIPLDRVCTVDVTFGGIITTYPESFDLSFPCVGTTLSFKISNFVEYKVCLDGMKRAEADTLAIVRGRSNQSGYAFDDTAPVSEGRNILKVVVKLVPVEDTAMEREAGSGG